ncbi:MAG: type II toxin-antitoxin system VapC family toxin [Gemmatimonadota bacterium]|nr:type II toxin-antitoxin system VapC family toxin [Gemmatimonadota bacterium]
MDTHIWVWMLEGDARRMAPAVVPLLERAAASAYLLVCDISFWEVAVKAAKGKLVLSLDPTIWLRQAEHAPGVAYLPLDRTILLQSARLAGEIHGDPGDRMLIALAQLRAAPLVTADERIVHYATTQRGVPVCDARP